MRVIYLAQVPADRFTLLERTTTDPGDAKAFYQEVAGLTTAPGVSLLPMTSEPPLGLRKGQEGEASGGPSGGPEPLWIAYIGVDDVDYAAKRAGELGGQVLMPPADLPGFGRAAVLRDSQGLAFGIFTRAR